VDGACQVVTFPRIDDASLIAGFKAAEFELRITSNEPLSFDWNSPDAAERVVCALFTSPPELASVEGTGAQELLRITNVSRSLARARTFNTESATSQQHFSFQIGDLRATPATSGTCPTALSLGRGSLPADYPIVELLRVGCWAFDSAKVMAATRLLPVAASSLPDSSNRVSDSCQAQAQGAWCWMPGTPGTCQNEACDVDKPEPIKPTPNLGDAGAGNSPLTAVMDCSGQPDDRACLKHSQTVGQCLAEECVSQGSDSYRAPLVVTSCDQGNDGLNCYPSPLLGFGNCLDKSCRPRCRIDSDCKEAFERAGVSTSPGLERFCDRVTNSYVGLCGVRNK